MLSFNDVFVNGGLVAAPRLICFGAEPVKTYEQLILAGGARKVSALCGFAFKSKVNADYPEFKIVFAVKMHSKIYRKQSEHQSTWHAERDLGNAIEIMSVNRLQDEYEFDMDEFMHSDLVVSAIPKFKHTITDGILSAKEFSRTLTDKFQIQEAANCIRSIIVSLPMMTPDNYNVNKNYSFSI